ncbi:MAG TPA: VanW family protein, partial [Polyangiaceae bacterium]|nr:VanW family protein [Polyangiaceae bacterium]
MVHRERDSLGDLSEAVTPPPPHVAPSEVVATTGAWWSPRAWRLRYALLFSSLPVVLLLLAFAIDRAFHAGEVVRGVTVASRSLAGMEPQALERALAEVDAELRSQPILVTVDARAFELAPDDVDLRLDREVLLDEAMRAGREGHLASQFVFWLARLGGSHTLASKTTFDAQKLTTRFERWAKEAISDPPFEGAIVVEDGVPVAKPPRAGRAVDAERSSALIVDAFGRRDSGWRDRAPVSLPIVDRAPERDADAVRQALTRARTLLRGSVTLTAEPPRDDEDDDDQERVAFTFDTTLLGRALRSRPGAAGKLDLYFDAHVLEPVLVEARQKLERPPLDARFSVNAKDEVTIRESRPGRVVNRERVAGRLLEIASGSSREGELPVDVGLAPTFSTENARALGIKGLVAQFTTSHACCQPRVKNIHRMAQLVDGVVLEPGQRFSLNEHVGERTKKNGFAEAPTIVRGKMKDTFGGGVSQFATTFFNAFFHGGYEIIERQPHSFYFARYPMGHEATLSYPKPDVIVRNDTDAGVLIRCVYSDSSISVRLYGDNGGRKVVRKVSPPYDFTDPPIDYVGDKKLSPKKRKVKDRGQKGWSITVARILTFGDGQEKREQRKVVYSPRPRILRVHPCRIPKREKGYTGEKCPEVEDSEEGDENDDA